MSVFNPPWYWKLLTDILSIGADDIEEIITDGHSPLGRFGITFPKLKKLAVVSFYLVRLMAATLFVIPNN